MINMNTNKKAFKDLFDKYHLNEFYSKNYFLEKY